MAAKDPAEAPTAPGVREESGRASPSRTFTVIPRLPLVGDVRVLITPYHLRVDDSPEGRKEYQVERKKTYYETPEGVYCDVGWEPEGVFYGFRVRNPTSQPAGLYIRIDGALFGFLKVHAHEEGWFPHSTENHKRIAFVPADAVDDVAAAGASGRGLIEIVVVREHEWPSEADDCEEQSTGGGGRLESSSRKPDESRKAGSCDGKTVEKGHSDVEYTVSDLGFPENYRWTFYVRLIAIPKGRRLATRPIERVPPKISADCLVPHGPDPDDTA